MAEQADCPFCDLSEQPASPFDINYPVGDGRTVIMPALGMLMPGYVMAVSEKHMTSFAQQERTELQELDAALSVSQVKLEASFGPYVRVEHGSDNVTTRGSGGCIDHAHQHLVPNSQVGDAILAKLPWQQLDVYEDLVEFRGEPYIYLGRLGLHYVVSQPDLPGQWTRRQIAEVQGHDGWDWALKQGAYNLLATFVALDVTPDRPMLFDMQQDIITFVG